MSLVHTVHPCEAIVNRLASIRNWATENVRDSRLSLGAGLALALLAGAPMPLPQIALAGPVLATLASGALGGRAAAALGFVSYLAISRPTAGLAIVAAGVAAFVGWGIPFLLEDRDVASRKASAVIVNCDGFASLDETYGHGSSAHVFDLLRRALETETRDSDLVVEAEEGEMILVLEGSNSGMASAVMSRVERRFATWLSDAGYECDLSVGMFDEAVMRSETVRETHRPSGLYLD